MPFNRASRGAIGVNVLATNWRAVLAVDKVAQHLHLLRHVRNAKLANLFLSFYASPA